MAKVIIRHADKIDKIVSFERYHYYQIFYHIWRLLEIALKYLTVYVSAFKKICYARRSHYYIIRITDEEQ